MTQSEMVRPIFIGRWTPKILFSLRERPYRHGHQRRRLGRISQRMLTRNLRQLESNCLVSRRVMQSKAIAVEYSLTADACCPARWHVPLGRTIPQGRDG